jgi:hypothetical protein
MTDINNEGDSKGCAIEDTAVADENISFGAPMLILLGCHVNC